MKEKDCRFFEIEGDWGGARAFGFWLSVGVLIWLREEFAVKAKKKRLLCRQALYEDEVILELI